MEWPGRNESIKIIENKKNKRFIKTTTTKELISSLQKLGNIDSKALTISALHNEVVNNLSNLVCESVFKLSLESSESLVFNNIISLYDILRKSSGFAIVNVQIAAALHDFPGMVLQPIQTRLSKNPGALYKNGKINKIDIFVDPYMNWNDNRCSIIENDFYNFEIKEGIDIVDSVDSKWGVKTPMESTYTKNYYFKTIPPQNTIITIDSSTSLI